jgi:hypothetical protein
MGAFQIVAPIVYSPRQRLAGRPSLRLRRKAGSSVPYHYLTLFPAAGEERVVDPLKAEQTGPKDSFGGESMGRVQLMRQFEMHPPGIVYSGNSNHIDGFQTHRYNGVRK